VSRPISKQAHAVDATVPAGLRDGDALEARLAQQPLAQPLEGQRLHLAQRPEQLVLPRVAWLLIVGRLLDPGRRLCGVALRPAPAVGLAVVAGDLLAQRGDVGLAELLAGVVSDHTPRLLLSVRPTAFSALRHQ
jgi:hypothetical protein